MAYGTMGVFSSSIGATRIPIRAYLHGGDAVLAGIGLVAFGFGIMRFAMAPLLRQDTGSQSDWKVLVVPGLVVALILAGLAFRFLVVEGPHLHDGPLR